MVQEDNGHSYCDRRLGINQSRILHYGVSHNRIVVGARKTPEFQFFFLVNYISLTGDYIHSEGTEKSTYEPAPERPNTRNYFEICDATMTRRCRVSACYLAWRFSDSNSE